MEERDKFFVFFFLEKNEIPHVFLPYLFIHLIRSFMYAKFH